MAKNPQIVTLTAAGTSAGLAVDTQNFSYGVGLVVGISVGGSATYTVECTGDRLDVPDANKLWVALPLLTSKTTAQTSNLAFPVTALRLNAASVTGTLQLSLITAG